MMDHHNRFAILIWPDLKYNNNSIHLNLIRFDLHESVQLRQQQQ